MIELKDTVALMNSADYKERFEAEYYQLETRYLKLKDMTEKWDKKTLNFEPTCPREIYNKQLSHMYAYLLILIDRATIENVHITIDEKIADGISTTTN